MSGRRKPSAVADDGDTGSNASFPPPRNKENRLGVKTAQTKYRPVRQMAPAPLIPKPGTNTQSKPTSYGKPLFDAIRGCDVEKVRDLVKVKKVKVKIVDEDDRWGPTPLLVASELQQLEIVEILLKAKPKADVNKANRRGRQPIWWAAKHGNKQLAEMLIYDGGKDCDVNTVDNDSGCAPLYRAILSGAPEVCRLLIHAGADVNLRRLWKVTGESEVAESPLVKSVQMNNFKVCEVLVNSLCKINAKTEDGFTALHYAVGYRRYEIAEFFLAEGAHVNVRSRKGVTAMTVAIREHLGAMCKILVEWGYDIDRKFKWDETPLEMAIRLHSDVCAKTLVAWGAAIVPDRKLRYVKKALVPPSLFQRAAKEGLVGLMEVMLEIHPYFGYEEWVRTRQLPLALYRYPDFCERLFKESEQSRTLVVLCRGAILRYLGKYSPKRLEKLPLPIALKSLLRLDHHFSEKAYRRMPLEDNDCPFHCPVLCPLIPQCPELDFSDSCSD